MRNDIKTRFQKGHTVGFKKGQSAWNKNKSWSEKIRKKLSEKSKLLWKDPEYRNKVEKNFFKKGHKPWNLGSNPLSVPAKHRKEEVAGRKKPEQCEICGAFGKIEYDHCHETGKFRGWICHRCNLILGLVRDDGELLFKLSNYLKKNYE